MTTPAKHRWQLSFCRITACQCLYNDYGLAI